MKIYFYHITEAAHEENGEIGRVKRPWGVGKKYQQEYEYKREN